MDEIALWQIAINFAVFIRCWAKKLSILFRDLAYLQL